MRPKKMIANAPRPEGFWGRIMLASMNRHHAALSVWGLKHLPRRDYGTGLDIGCGGGANLKRLARICSGTVHGIDVSPLSVEKSKSVCRALVGRGRVSVKIGDAEKTELPDGSLDLVTAFETVYFWRDLDAALTEIKRVLCDDGVLLIVNEMTAKDDEPNKYAAVKAVIDLNVYSAEDLERRLLNAGFKSVRIFTDGDMTAALATKTTHSTL